MSKKAIYPGTFDPFTNGHADIVAKAIKIADELIIAVAEDNCKTPIFSVEERVEMINNELLQHDTSNIKVSVESFKGLLMDYALKKNCGIIIRGLRAISDFEYEFQMSCMNSRLAPMVQTIFLPASERTHFISSRLVKEVARLKGDISQVVSPSIKSKLEQKFK
jgi:pantetheine-phosphate adenylyltransferase